MARGGKRGARPGRGRANVPSYGARISKPQAESSTQSGPKPMDIDNKMSQSLDDIIKQQRATKKPTSAAPKKSKNSNNEGKRKNNKNKQRPLQKRSAGGPSKPVAPSNLQITVRADKIPQRPLLNQIISNAELHESQRASRHVAPRLRERVQPVSLDYKVGGSGDHFHARGPSSSSYHHPQQSRRHDGYMMDVDRQYGMPAPMNIDSHYNNRRY